MKKFLSVFVMLLMLAGCGTKTQVEPKLSGISFDALISYEDYECRCEVKAYGGGLFECSVLEPSSIEGLKVTFDGNKTVISYMGLAYTPELPIPNENVSEIIGSVVSSAAVLPDNAKKQGDVYILTGMAGGYDYTLTLTESGLPLLLESRDAQFKAEISNVEIIDTGKNR